MKTKNILLTAAILCNYFVTAQGQSENSASFDGIQSTFNNVFNFNPFEKEARKALRLFMIRTSDISMMMTGKISEQTYSKNSKSREKKNSLYAEFDWDNLALSMHTITTTLGLSLFINNNGGFPIILYENIDHYQYTDKEGYWYTPFDDPNNPGLYVKTNAKKVAISVLNDLYSIDTFIGENFNDDIIEKLNKKFTENFVYPYLGKDLMVLKNILNERKIDKSKFEEAIKKLKDEKKMQMIGFPIFIHWALLYSPDKVRNNFNVVEAKTACGNIPNGCTKLTVASGKEKGKFMVFDQYDRLILINSKNEGTVKYNYDRDLSVILPPAMTFAETVFYYRKQNAGDKRKKEMDETIKEAKEKAKKKGGKDEKQKEKEKERLRNEELAKLEEQFKEAVTPQEREEIQQKIKELKELREKENENNN